MEYLEGMLQKEKDNFGRGCNRLLGTCFLCKGNQNTRLLFCAEIQERI